MRTQPSWGCALGTCAAKVETGVATFGICVDKLVMCVFTLGDGQDKDGCGQTGDRCF
jgi:hypothetical protein